MVFFFNFVVLIKVKVESTIYKHWLHTSDYAIQHIKPPFNGLLEPFQQFIRHICDNFIAFSIVDACYVELECIRAAKTVHSTTLEVPPK